jgi:hypothetical protein
MNENSPYFYILMSQKSFVENETIEEILRERTTYRSEQNLPPDFWIIWNPSFLRGSQSLIQETNYYFQNKSEMVSPPTCLLSPNSVQDFMVAIVSLTKEFVQWLEIRYGEFEDISFLSSSSLSQKRTKFNGIKGALLPSQNPLLSCSSDLHPSLLLSIHQKFLTSFSVPKEG